MKPTQCRAAACLLGALLAAPAAAEEVKLVREGLTLNANLETVEGNWPAGPVVLLTHGTLAHNGMEIIATLQGLLKDRDLSSLAINLSLGLDDRHGMYDCATPHTHRHADAVGEIGAWLAWLEEQGAEQVVLMGHSRGGNQTAWFAAEHDDPAVKAVVLVAPATWDAAREAAAYEKRYGEPVYNGIAQAFGLVGAKKPDALMDVDFIYCEDTRATAAAFLSYYGADPRRDTPTLLPKIAEPVLVVAGSADEVVSDVPERVEPLADGQKITLEVIDGASHFFRDLYAEDLADLVAEFVQNR